MELVKSAELIIGPQRDVVAFGLDHGDDAGELQKKIGACISKKREQGYEVLVMCDLLGGTPCNVTAANLIQQDFACITGVNLPMLIEAIDSREDDSIALDELAVLCNEAGKRGILNIDRKKFGGNK